MIKCGVIGVGAAGNHAAISLIEAGVANISDVILLNSTLKDVPEKYKEIAIEFDSDSKGCAKERHLAQRITMANLKSNKIGIDQFINEEYAFILICPSAEAGSGSGASITLAKYVSQALHKAVHLTVFAGFYTDSRGLKNTIDWFKETSPEWTVDCICNANFLEENFGNERKAELAANNEFVQRVQILTGMNLIDSDNNIDDVDLTKLVTTPGYQMIVHGDLGKIKNTDEFNKVVKKMIDESKGFGATPSCIRMGVILNISEKIGDSIDYSFGVLKACYGMPFEVFTHVQHNETGNTIQIVASGSKMPIDEINDIYNDFQERNAKIDMAPDTFYNAQFDTASDRFDMDRGGINPEQVAKDKAAFFGEESPAENTGSFSGTRKIDM